MINICVCLHETARSLKFSARFNPTVFHIALLSLLLCAIYARYITIKFNVPRLRPRLVRAIRISRDHASRWMFARVYASSVASCYEKKNWQRQRNWYVYVMRLDSHLEHRTYPPDILHFQWKVMMRFTSHETYFAKYMVVAFIPVIGSTVKRNVGRCRRYFSLFFQ